MEERCQFVAATARRFFSSAYNVASEPSVQVTTATAIGGAVTLGAGGGIAGLATGGAIGGAIGFLPAIFTFGLSIPIGVAIGGGIGFGVGIAGGGGAGLLSGGTVGYVAYAKRSKIWRTWEAIRNRLDIAFDHVEDYVLKIIGHRMQRRAQRMNEASATNGRSQAYDERVDATIGVSGVGVAGLDLAKATAAAAASELNVGARRMAGDASAAAIQKTSDIGSEAKRIVTDQHNQVTAATAVGGAVTAGAAGGATGAVAGGTIGAGIGLLMAPFTLGLSIPVGAILGGSTGLVTGAAAGGTAGAVGGGAIGYGAYAKRDEISEAASGLTSSVGAAVTSVKDTAVASGASVRQRVLPRGSSGSASSDAFLIDS